MEQVLHSRIGEILLSSGLSAQSRFLPLVNMKTHNQWGRLLIKNIWPGNKNIVILFKWHSEPSEMFWLLVFEERFHEKHRF